MVTMGRCLVAVVLVFSLGGCKKSDGTPTDSPADTTGGGGAAATEEGGGGPEGGGAGAGGADEPAAGGGAMSVADFCRTYGEKAKKEGGKAADFWERNLGKDCEKDLGGEKKKKGDDKWKAFVDCANSKATAADAFDECEM